MKKIVLLSIICLLLIWPTLGLAHEEAKTTYFKGTEFLRRLELDSAITELTKAINILVGLTSRTADETDMLADAFNNRGLAYREKGNYNLALQDLAWAYNLGKTKPKILSNYALVLYEMAETYPSYYGLAAYIYELAIEWSTGDEAHLVDIYNNLGVCYANQSTPDQAKAEAAYKKAIDLNTTKGLDYTDAYYNLANLYYNQGKALNDQGKKTQALVKYDLAIQNYDITISFYEGSKKVESATAVDNLADSYYNRGLCKYDQGKYNEAIPDFEKVLEVRPGDSWAHYAKGYSHFMLNDYDKAVPEFETILGSEIDAYARYGLGVVYCKQDNMEKGLNFLNQSCDAGNQTACQALSGSGDALKGL